MKRTIEYIEQMVCFYEHIGSEMLHTPGKLDPYVTIRQIIMTLSLEHNHTMQEIGDYFSRNHATALHARKSIYNRCETDKVFDEKYKFYKEELKDSETFKANFLAHELARLKTETMELMNQLNQIAI